MDPVVPWMPDEQAPVNTRFDARAVHRDGAVPWLPTRIDGLEARVLEYLPWPDGRLAVQLRQQDPDHRLPVPIGPGTEFFVQQGDVRIGDSDWPAGLYVREPPLPEQTDDAAVLWLCSANESSGSATERRAVVYLSVGHLPHSDSEQRIINTGDAERWLPGPVEGTDVLPLHGHGTANAMLVRWRTEVAFRPRLDPLGEEVLVLRGALHDADGSYPAGSWIRNPVPAWQSWGGERDTVVLYKSGHFPSDGDA